MGKNGYSRRYGFRRPTLTSFGEHVIDTVQGSRPVKAKRFRMSPRQEEEVNRQVEQMVKDGIARPSNSPWTSNVTLVKKKDNATRFAVDYRQLNDLTVKDSYPMPNIREIIDKMTWAKYFSKWTWLVPAGQCPSENKTVKKQCL